MQTLVAVVCTGGNATMPICAAGGFIMPSIVRMPSLALLKSVQVAVRSGRAAHGAGAVDREDDVDRRR